MTPIHTTYRRLSTDAGASAATAPGPVAVEIENRTPHREPNLQADVTVPIMQAFITATIAAVGVLAGGWLAEKADAWRYGLGVFVVVLAGAWLWRLGVVTSLLAVIERITQHDLNHSGGIGDTAHTMLENPGQARQEAAQLDRARQAALSTLDLLTFYQKCRTVGCSETAHGVGTGTQARARFAEKRDVLIQLGLAGWKDSERRAAGWGLLNVPPEDATRLIRQHVIDIRA